MVKVKLHGHKKNRVIRENWLRIATDLNAGMTPTEIVRSRKYINSATRKPYTRAHIYYIVRQLNTKSLVELGLN